MLRNRDNNEPVGYGGRFASIFVGNICPHGTELGSASGATGMPAVNFSCSDGSGFLLFLNKVLKAAAANRFSLTNMPESA